MLERDKLRFQGMALGSMATAMFTREFGPPVLSWDEEIEEGTILLQWPDKGLAVELVVVPSPGLKLGVINGKTPSLEDQMKVEEIGREVMKNVFGEKKIGEELLG